MSSSRCISFRAQARNLKVRDDDFNILSESADKIMRGDIGENACSVSRDILVSTYLRENAR